MPLADDFDALLGGLLSRPDNGKTEQVAAMMNAPQTVPQAPLSALGGQTGWPRVKHDAAVMAVPLVDAVYGLGNVPAIGRSGPIGGGDPREKPTIAGMTEADVLGKMGLSENDPEVQRMRALNWLRPGGVHSIPTMPMSEAMAGMMGKAPNARELQQMLKQQERILKAAQATGDPKKIEAEQKYLDRIKASAPDLGAKAASEPAKQVSDADFSSAVKAAISKAPTAGGSSPKVFVGHIYDQMPENMRGSLDDFKRKLLSMHDKGDLELRTWENGWKVSGEASRHEIPESAGRNFAPFAAVYDKKRDPYAR